MEGQTRSTDVIQALLRQAVGNEGPVTVKVPFSVTNLNNWKIITGSYIDNPDRVASTFDLMIRTQDPDWNDIEAVLMIVFDATEWGMIKKTAKTQIEAQIAAGALQGQPDTYLPEADPSWDLNNLADKYLLGQYQRWILFGIKNVIPKALNWSKLYEIKQD